MTSKHLRDVLGALEAKYAPKLLSYKKDSRKGHARHVDLILRNVARKRLFRDLESRGNTGGGDKGAASVSDRVVLEANESDGNELSRRLDALKLLCKLERPKSSPVGRVLKIIRLVFTLPWMVCGGAYLFIFAIICRFLDPIFEKWVFGTGENAAGKLPSDLIQMWYAKSVLYCAGVKVVVEGKEYVQAARKSGSVVMFSHASFLDPFILSSVAPLSLRYVGKQSVFLLPIFGWAAWLFGHVPINRKNRDRAIESLKRVSKYLSRPGRAVAISPEGTRSTTGQIRDFKKGPFYLRGDTASDILPVYLSGAFELWPPGRPFTSSGTIFVRFLPLITNETAEKEMKGSRGHISDAVRDLYLEAAASPANAESCGGLPLPWSEAWKTVLAIIASLYAELILVRGVKGALALLNLSSLRTGLLFAVLIAVMTRQIKKTS